MNYDAMIVGLMAASFVTFWLQTVDSIPKAASAVFFSALLSSFGGPVAAVYLIAKFPTLKDASETLPLLAAVIIGSTVTWGFPLLINFMKNKYGGTNV
jgi:predicted membrane-bound spermidine synthase